MEFEVQRSSALISIDNRQIDAWFK